MLNKLDAGARRISRGTFNGLVDSAESLSNLNVVGADMTAVGCPVIGINEQPEPGCWARVTQIVTDTYGNFLLDGRCRLQYDWIEQERYLGAGGAPAWRDKLQTPRHSIPRDDGSQHMLKEVNGRALHVGDIVWVYPGILKFDGPTPNHDSWNWEHLTIAPPEKPIRVKTNEDWYACQCITGTQQTVTRCGTSAQSCPEPASCPSCETCSACDSCPDPSCDSCPSCSGESAESGSSGSGSSSSSSSGSGSATSAAQTACLGVTPCCPNSAEGASGCSCPKDDIHSPLATCDGTIYLADPLGTIGESNMYAIADDDGDYYIPAGTYLYVEHLDDAYDEDGNPLYEPTGGWGTGCACSATPCSANSCQTCPSCGASCSCPGSCPSCGSCGSGSSGSGSSGSGSSGSGSSGGPSIPPCPGAGDYVLCCKDGVLSWCSDESFDPPLVPI